MLTHKGIAYPLTKNHQGFFHHSNTDVEQIKANIATIIMTDPVERVMEPRFGVPLMSINTNRPMEVVKDNIIKIVSSAITRWLPKIQLRGVTVNLSQVEEELIIMISVFFINPVNIKNVEQLHIQKSLGGVNVRPMPF